MQNLLVITASFFVAFVLTLLPMPDWTAMLRPAWVLMVVIYWNMMMPYRVNIGVAWFVGLLLDVLNGTLLGEHALAMVMVSYIVVKIHTRLRMSPLLQQAISVLALTLFYQFIIYCVQGFIGDLPRGWLYWASSVMSMLLWPWVLSILQDYRRRFKVA